MTVGDPHSRAAAVDVRNRCVAIPLHDAPASLRGLAAQRYRRNWLVADVGEAGQARIAAARVLVVGAALPGARSGRPGLRHPSRPRLLDGPIPPGPRKIGAH